MMVKIDDELWVNPQQVQCIEYGNVWLDECTKFKIKDITPLLPYLTQVGEQRWVNLSLVKWVEGMSWGYVDVFFSESDSLTVESGWLCGSRYFQRR